MPGKYYSNHTADRLQNWLTTGIDPVATSGVPPYNIKAYILRTLQGGWGRTYLPGRFSMSDGRAFAGDLGLHSGGCSGSAYLTFMRPNKRGR